MMKLLRGAFIIIRVGNMFRKFEFRATHPFFPEGADIKFETENIFMGLILWEARERILETYPSLSVEELDEFKLTLTFNGITQQRASTYTNSEAFV